jgi:hypothetical protein
MFVYLAGKRVCAILSGDPQRLTPTLSPQGNGRQHKSRDALQSGYYKRGVQGENAARKTQDGVQVAGGGDEKGGGYSCSAA